MTNDENISNGQASVMFLVIQSLEQKNVRTLEYDSKTMVNKLTNYILKAAKEEKESGGDEK